MEEAGLYISCEVKTLFLLIIFNSSIFHHPKLNCKANFHTKYQIKLQAVTNHMIYIKPYMRKAEIRTFADMTRLTSVSAHGCPEVPKIPGCTW
jgi:hypothetical protein